jgi:hypothetical protein
MDWTQVLTIVGAILAIVVANWYMFLWSRSETNAQIIKIENWILEIHKEMKDFHGKLCAIEERKKMEKE